MVRRLCRWRDGRKEEGLSSSLVPCHRGNEGSSELGGLTSARGNERFRRTHFPPTVEERGCLEGNSITPGTALLAFRSDIWKLFDRSKCPNKYLYWQLYTCHPFANVQMTFELPFLLLFGMSWFFPHQS